MKKEAVNVAKAVPPFNEAILKPVGAEVVCAVRTAPLHEFKLEEHCAGRGIVTYLPLRRTLKVHKVTSKGRPYSYSREVLRPLFPSYLFVKAELPLIRELYDTRRIQRYLQPVNLESFLDEIRVVRKCETVGFGQELEVHEEIPEGGRFLITSGVLEGVEGCLTQRDGVFKWTVEIEFCQQFITMTIDPTKFAMKPLDD